MERLQPELDHTMRSVLIDWLVEVAQVSNLLEHHQKSLLCLKHSKPRHVFGSLLARLTTVCTAVQNEANHALQEFKLVPETLHLAVTFLDRFLSVETINRNTLQLVGITCVLVAAKYEEIYAPSVCPWAALLLTPTR